MFSRRLLSLALLLTPLSALAQAAPAHAAEPIRCTVVLDAETGGVVLRRGSCDQAVYPQSTFKLPLAMMGYEAGILKDEHDPRWEYQAKFNRSQREQKTTDPTIWEKDSIVWYSQEITRRLGKQSFADYVSRFGYGNRDVSGGPGGTDGLTEAWLMSSLKISSDQQADFMRRFVTGKLPISPDAVRRTQAIVPVFDAADGWIIHGKTGSGSMRNGNGKGDGNRPIGWFVGWAENGSRKVVFARLLVDNKRHTDKPISYTVRDSLIADLPGLAAGR